ncbi:MAG TPA: squalene--hopene cyclase [Casimicrobiaceae bacterium]|nr:squalene--hopene cyclase [Casimicrobiaceae bacterium]
MQTSIESRPGRRIAFRRREASRETLAPVDAALARARAAIVGLQNASGFWCHELEADCTIPAEYVLMLHYFGETDPALEAGIANYLRARQGRDGGWPLYDGGAMDVSCSVKAYFALKLSGDSPEARHMRRAREAILARGGAARANVFTRIALALFGELPWRGVPFVPVEIVLLPRWFPFHPLKVSYWSRTVMIPLSVLTSLKPRARNPRGVSVRELFTTAPENERQYFPVRSPLNRVFIAVDALLRRCERLLPKALRARALRCAEDWIVERLNGRHGLGAIFPAMVNAAEALELLGYPPDHRLRLEARQGLADLLVRHGSEAYCQPCFSTVWDTALTCLALEEDDDAPAETLSRALEWLAEKQLLEASGDWRASRPQLKGGGWAFQFENAHYPDLDDTAVAAWAMHAAPDAERHRPAIGRAADWLVGMQSSNGGFAAFDVDNDHAWLNEIPFADHGALLDPPTSDVTARVVTLLARLDRPQDRPALERALGFLRREQCPHGCWFGRWGTNYIYGTWSVLTAFAAARIPPEVPEVRRAVAWLESCQRADGGWGETNDSYFDPALAGSGSRSTACQTAWALLGLMAAGDAGSDAVARGVRYLMRTQRAGRWHDREFNAPGFPRVFHLKYHGYSQYFPYWALARYRHAFDRAR